MVLGSSSSRHPPTNNPSKTSSMMHSPSSNASQTSLSSSQPTLISDASAIEDAWRDHEKQLKPWEKQLFAQYNLKDLQTYHAQLLEDVKRQDAKSRTVRVARVLQPFVAALEMYVPLVNSVSWSSPVPVASCILGGVQCLAQVPMHFLDMQQTILDELDGIGIEISRLLRYEEQLFKDNLEINIILYDVFKGFFSYLRKVAKLFYDKQGNPKARRMVKKALFSDYQLQFGEIKQKIVGDIERFERTAEFAVRVRTAAFQEQALFSLSRLNAVNDGQNTILADHGRPVLGNSVTLSNTHIKRKQVQPMNDAKRTVIYDSWIPWIDFAIKHKQNSRRLAGTGQWLLHHPNFVKWQHSDDPDPILTVQGKAGSGKSFLAATVVEELQATYIAEPCNVPVVRIYCGAMKRFQANRSWLFGSILRQLLDQLEEKAIDRELERAYDQCGQRHPNEERLEELVELVISKFKKIFLIIDGLEECQRLEAEDFERVCSSLQSLARSSTIPLRLIVFGGRNYKLFERHFGSHPYIIIDSGANHGDMKQYIHQKLFEAEPHVYSRRSLCEEVEQALLEKADGVFLWLSRMIPILRNCDSVPEIREAMDSLPKDMGHYYNETLSNIIAGSKRTVRHRSMKMLIALCNARRPLTSGEMGELLAVEPGVSDVDPDALIVSTSALTSGCHDLVVLQDDVYEPIHKSLKDWIRQIGQSAPPELRELQILQRQAEREFAITCLTYLRFERFRRPPLQNEKELHTFLNENPFFGYAATYWGKHVAQAENLTSEDEEMVYELLDCSDLRDLCLQVLVFNGQIEIEMSWKKPNSNALHLLANFDLVSYAEEYAMSAMVSEVDAFGALPLDYALANRFKDISIWILNKAGDANIAYDQLAFLFPPLHIAAALDWPDVIGLLLKLGFDADSRDPNTDATALHHASHDGSEAACTYLLSAGASLEARDADNQTALLVAAWARQTRIIHLLIEAGADVNTSGWQDWTALHHVAMNGDVSATRKLTQSAASKDCRTMENQTPLHLAARYDQVEVLRQLTQPGDDTEAEDVVSRTALLLAAQSGNVKAVRHLISRDAVLDHRDSRGFTALHYAAALGYTAVVSVLCLADGGLTRVLNDEGKTPLVTAIDADHSDAALQLLDLGSPVGPYGEQQERPLHRAIEHDMQDVVNAIIRNHPEEVHARDSLEFTALHYAARHGLGDIAEALVVMGNADLNAINCNERSVSWVAAKHNRATFLARLLQLQDMATPTQQVDFNTLDKDQGTLLHAAALNGATDSLQFLLQRGLVASRDADSNTPLYHAASSGSVDCVKLLMPKGGDDHIHSIQTALFKAVSNTHLSVVEFLLQSGADPNHYEQSHTSHEYFGQGTLFQLAINSGNLELVRLIVHNRQAGTTLVDICGPNWLCDVAKSGNTDLLDLLLSVDNRCNHRGTESQIEPDKDALFLAAENGHPIMVQRLGELHFNVNRATSTLQRPLHAAIAGGHYLTAQTLLDLGADINVQDATGLTALACAAKSYRHKCFQVLLGRGADPLIKDNSGYDAWDHISEDPQFWSRFSFVPQDQLSKAEIQRLRDLWSTAVQQVNPVLLLPSPPCTKVLNERCLRLLLVLKDMMQMADEHDEHEAVGDNAQHLGNKRRGSHAQLMDYQCPVCLRYIEYEGKFVCMSCEDTSMCRECHIECSEMGSKHIARVPRAREIWEKLEQNIQRVRCVVADKCDFGVENLVTTISDYFIPVLLWFETALSAYRDWLREFGSTARWQKLPRPGLEFLELIQEARDFVTEDESLGSNCSTEELGSVTAINDRLSQHFERHPADLEVEIFQCEGHEYIEFSRFLSINRQRTFDLSKHTDTVTHADLDQLIAKAMITIKDSKNRRRDGGLAVSLGENGAVNRPTPSTARRCSFPLQAQQRITRLRPDIKAEWDQYNTYTGRSAVVTDWESSSSSDNDNCEDNFAQRASVSSAGDNRSQQFEPRPPGRAYTLYGDDFSNPGPTNAINLAGSRDMLRLRSQAQKHTHRKPSVDRQVPDRLDGSLGRGKVMEDSELDAKCASLAVRLYQTIKIDKSMSSMMDDDEILDDISRRSRQDPGCTNERTVS